MWERNAGSAPSAMWSRREASSASSRVDRHEATRSWGRFRMKPTVSETRIRGCVSGCNARTVVSRVAKSRLATSTSLKVSARMREDFPALDLMKGLADPSCATSSTPSLFGPGHALAGREVLEPCQLHLKLRFFGASMPMKNLEDDGRPIVNLDAGRFSNVSHLCGG